MTPGGHLNIKMPSYQYRHSHVKDKTVSPTILSLTWESPYLGKTVFILRQGPDGTREHGKHWFMEWFGFLNHPECCGVNETSTHGSCWHLAEHIYCLEKKSLYGSGHRTVAVLLPGFAIN